VVYNWLKNNLNACLPQACLLCGDNVPRQPELALCRRCEADLPVLGESCLRCANPLETALERLEGFLSQPALLQTRECGQCLQQLPYFDQTLAFFPYISPFNHFVHAAKFKGKLSTARLLGQLMAQQLSNNIDLIDNLPDGLLPVPLHPSRQRERGYNQALEIALPVSQRLQIPILSQVAVRVTATTAQSSLPLKQRKQNLNRAFMVKEKLKNQHIAIIDDVMTSGATVNALAKVLKQAGAARVSIWCFCRAEPPT